MTIYTAIFGGYDRLREPLAKQSAKMICFTDAPELLKSDAWEIHRMDPMHSNPRRAARRVKILGAPQGVSVWIDSSIILRRDLEGLVNVSLAQPNGEFSACRHRDRSCVYQEIDACIRRQKDSASILEAQRAKYHAAGMPGFLGLYECGMLIRDTRAHWVRDLCRRWHAEYDSASCRDQPALPYVCWQAGRWPYMIPLNLWDNPYTVVDQRRGVIVHDRAKNVRH